MLAETRKANAKGSFGASVSLGLKHSSNAVTKPHREDLVAENDLREQYSADWALRNLVLEGLVQDYYDNNLPNSDAAATSSLAFSYSRELDGLTERRFNASISHYASHQGGEDLENLDIGVTSMRLGLVLPIQRRAKQPLSDTAVLPPGGPKVAHLTAFDHQAVRKFFFFLDSRRRGRVAINEVLCSPILQELLDLRRPDLSADDLRSNWFSQHSAAKMVVLAAAPRATRCSSGPGPTSRLASLV